MRSAAWRRRYRPASLSPTADVVARAQAVISGRAAADVAKYQADLQQAEASSRVTPAAFANLKADDVSLVHGDRGRPRSLAGGHPAARRTPGRPRPGVHRREQQWLRVEPGVAATGHSPLRRDLHEQCPESGVHRHADRGARQAHVTAAERQRLVADEKAIDTALGPNVDTDPGRLRAPGPAGGLLRRAGHAIRPQALIDSPRVKGGGRQTLIRSRATPRPIPAA